MAQPAFQNCLASMARLRTSYEATIATEAGDSSELHIECRLVLEEVRAACHTLKAVFAEDNITAHMVLNSHVYRQQSVAIANGKYLDKSRAKHGKSVPADSPEAQSMLRAIDEELDAIIALPDGPKRYSAVTSDEAIRMLDSLQLAELDGNLQDRIVPPADAPECTVFDYSNYATEDEGTPDLMQHHALALQKLGVVVGRGGVSAYDLHSDEDCKDFFTIKMAAQEYTGGVDGCIAPFGLFRSSATWRSLIVYVHKQSAQQKQAYAEKQSGQQQAGEAIGSSAISFSNSRGQMLSTMLGVYAYCVCPVMLDLTDGHVHHLMQIHGTEVCIWADLTPTQAYYKQAEYLRAIIGMVGSARLKEFKIEDLTEEEKLTMQKLRSLKPRSQSEEQLDSIIPHLPEDQRVQATFEMITSWQHAAPQRLPTELNARLGNWFAD